MLLAQHGILGVPHGGDTTPDGKQVFVLMGDSIGRGNSTAAGTTPTAGTVYQWNASGSSVDQVGASDLLEVQAAGTTGSPWPRFGIDYYNATQKKATFVCTAIGGSAWYSNSAGDSWYTNGSLYSNAVTKTNNALAAMKLTRVKGVIIVLGINDAMGALGLDLTYLTSLITRINSDFFSPRIFVSIPDKDAATSAVQQRLFTLRVMIKSLSVTYNNVEVGGNIHSIRTWDSATYFQGDDVHLTFDGNELLGTMLARQADLANTNTYDKLARSIVCNMFTTLSSARESLINNFIVAQRAKGNIPLLDNFYLFKNSSVQNASVNWGFTADTGTATGATFNTNASLETDGSTNSIALHALTLNTNDTANYDSDHFEMVRIADNNAGAGVDGTMYGIRCTATGGLIDIAQTSSNTIYYRVSSLTTKTWSGGDTHFNSNTLYGTARKSGVNDLIKNGVVVDQQTIANLALGASLGGIRAGGRNNNGTIDSRLAIEFQAYASGKYTGFDILGFYNDLEILLAGW